MTVALREAHDLVFDRRAVANTGSVDDAGVERRAIEVVADDRVRPRRGVGQVACHLRQRQPRRGPVKRPRVLVAPLLRELGVVDGRAPQARRCARLQARQPEAQRPQGVGEIVRGEFSRPPGALTREPDVDQTPEERPRGDDDRARVVPDAELVFDPDDVAALHDEVPRLPLAQVEVRLGLDGLLHRGAIARAVALRAGRAHRGAPRSVERLHLDGCTIGRAPHLPAERVDLAHEMPLRGAADGRVTGHLRDRVEAHRQQQRSAAHSRGGECRFTTGVTGADDDDIPRGHDGYSGRAAGVLQRFAALQSLGESPTMTCTFARFHFPGGIRGVRLLCELLGDECSVRSLRN